MRVSGSSAAGSRRGRGRPLWASLSSARCAVSPLAAVLAAVLVWGTARPVAAPGRGRVRLGRGAARRRALRARRGDRARARVRAPAGRGRPRERAGTAASDDPDRALRYLLRGTGVRAERIRAGQYVLIREPLNVRPDIETTREAYTGTLDGPRGRRRDRPAADGRSRLARRRRAGRRGRATTARSPSPTSRPAATSSACRTSGYKPVRLELDVFPDSPRLPPTIRLQAETIESLDAAVVAGPDPPGPTPGMTELGARQAAAIPYALGEADLAATLSWLPGPVADGRRQRARSSSAAPTRPRRATSATASRSTSRGTPSGCSRRSSPRRSRASGSTAARCRPPLGGGLAAVLDVETTDALAGDTLRTVGARGRRRAGPWPTSPLGDRVGLHVGLRRSVLGPSWRPRCAPRAAPRCSTRPAATRSGREPGDPSVVFGDADAKVSLALGPTAHLDVGGTRSGTDAVRVDLPSRGGTGSTTAGGRTRPRHALQGAAGAEDARDGPGLPDGPRGRRRRARPAGTARTDQSLVEHGASLDVDRFVSLAHQVRGGVQVAHRAVDGRRRSGRGTVRGDEARQRVGPRSRSTRWTRGDRRGLAGPAGPARRGARRRARRGRPRPEPAPVRALDARRGPAGRPGRPEPPDAGGPARPRPGLGDATRSPRRAGSLADRGVPLARAWQLGAGVEWAPLGPVRVQRSTSTAAGRGACWNRVGASRPEAGIDPGELLATHPAHDGRAVGVELAARYDAGRLDARAQRGARERPRPPAGGRGLAAVGLRPAGRARPPRPARARARGRPPCAWTWSPDWPAPTGPRDAAQVRASAALGAHATRGGLRWTALAQATARPSAPSATRRSRRRRPPARHRRRAACPAGPSSACRRGGSGAARRFGEPGHGTRESRRSRAETRVGAGTGAGVRADRVVAAGTPAPRLRHLLAFSQRRERPDPADLDLADGTVTRVAQQKKDLDRASVYIDDAFAFGLAVDLVIEAGLRKGVVLTAAAAARAARPPGDVRRQSRPRWPVLSNRARTSDEVRQSLLRKGFAETIAEDTVADLERHRAGRRRGLRAAFVRDRFNGRGYGPSRLRQDLMRKGVARRDHRRGARGADRGGGPGRGGARAGGQEVALAGVGGATPRKRQKKTLDFLVRRGFGFDTARSAVEDGRGRRGRRAGWDDA